MSIVCAAVKDGEIAIAADTQTNFGSTIISSAYLDNCYKLFPFRDNVIGFVGWNATWNIVEHLLSRNDIHWDFSSRNAVFDTLLKLQPTLKNEYFLETKEDDDQPVESNQLDMLLATPNGLFHVGSLREVNEIKTYWAIGSGKRFAYGAMYALWETDNSVQHIAEAGAAAAAEFDESCGFPVNIASVKLAQA